MSSFIVISYFYNEDDYSFMKFKIYDLAKQILSNEFLLQLPDDFVKGGPGMSASLLYNEATSEIFVFYSFGYANPTTPWALGWMSLNNSLQVNNEYNVTELISINNPLQAKLANQSGSTPTSIFSKAELGLPSSPFTFQVTQTPIEGSNLQQHGISVTWAVPEVPVKNIPGNWDGLYPVIQTGNTPPSSPDTPSGAVSVAQSPPDMPPVYLCSCAPGGAIYISTATQDEVIASNVPHSKIRWQTYPVNNVPANFLNYMTAIIVPSETSPQFYLFGQNVEPSAPIIQIPLDGADTETFGAITGMPPGATSINTAVTQPPDGLNNFLISDYIFATYNSFVAPVLVGTQIFCFYQNANWNLPNYLGIEMAVFNLDENNNIINDGNWNKTTTIVAGACKPSACLTTGFFSESSTSRFFS